jgi:hypothetical protein
LLDEACLARQRVVGGKACVSCPAPGRRELGLHVCGRAEMHLLAWRCVRTAGLGISMAARRTSLDLPLPLQFLAAWLAVWLGRVLQDASPGKNVDLWRSTKPSRYKVDWGTEKPVCQAFSGETKESCGLGAQRSLLPAPSAVRPPALRQLAIRPRGHARSRPLSPMWRPGGQESAPAEGHETGDATLADLDAELEQLTMDSGRAPGHVGLGHPSDEPLDSAGTSSSVGVRERDFDLQNRRKPARCQRTTASGLTMTRASAQRDQI